LCCNAAVIYSARIALPGGTPSFRDLFAAAASRKGAVLAWGAFTGTVSLLMRAAEQRLGPLGRIFTALGGLAWSMVSCRSSCSTAAARSGGADGNDTPAC
jgi:Family of unknown function (DUF6159)